MADKTKFNQISERGEVRLENPEKQEGSEKRLKRIELKFKLDDVNKFFGLRWGEFERITNSRSNIFTRQLILAQKGVREGDFAGLPPGFLSPLLENGKKCGRSFRGELNQGDANETKNWQYSGHTPEVIKSHFEALKAMVDFYNNDENFEILRNAKSRNAAMLMKSLKKVVNIANALYGKTDEFFNFLSEESKEPSKRSADFDLDNYAQNILGLEPGVDYFLTEPIEPEKPEEPKEIETPKEVDK